MLKHFLTPALLLVLVAAPASAQRNRERISTPTKNIPQFLSLFSPAVEAAAQSVVRVQVDGKDVAMGTVVSEGGYVLTKASELKAGRVSVKTRDGRDCSAEVCASSEPFDLAVLKVDGTGLVPISWGSTADALVGNWVAVPALGRTPAAVGVVSTGPQTLPPPPRDGSPRVPDEQRGFLGVELGPGAKGATIQNVTRGSAADRAGIKASDVIVRIDTVEIGNGDALITTLSAYKVGTNVRVVVERDGKRLELTAVLGKRPLDRGAQQNSMGSTLSDRRSGIPRFFQTDAVVKPTDCGAPLVDLDGRAVGLVIARAGRTESHAVPAETVRELVPLLLASSPKATWADKTVAARLALKVAEEAKASSEVIAEGKRLVAAAVAEEEWWKDRPIEKAPEPREATK